MVDVLLFDIGLVIIAATFLAYIAKLFKMQFIPMYIIAGILLGPYGLQLVHTPQIIQTLSELGIAFLLFIVGMQIDLSKLKEVGSFATIGGTLQVLICFFSSFIISLIFGFSYIESIFLGLILSFSSTMVVVKLVSEKDELETMPGRMMLGILLMQDLLTILALSILMSAGSTFYGTFLIILKAFLLIGFGIFFKKVVSTPIFKFAGNSTELLFLSSLSTMFAFVSLSNVLNFPSAIGAFIGGLSLTSYPYTLEIVSKVTSLRDFFATLFFVSLGLQLSFGNFIVFLLPILFLIAFVIIVKPFIILIIANSFGYETRTSFTTAIGLAQISEFSLLIAAFGVTSTLISPSILSIAAIIAIFTISLTPYFINYSNAVYNRLALHLKIFDNLKLSKNKLSELGQKKINNHITLVGCHTFGSGLLQTFKSLKKQVIVLDYNPETVKALLKDGVNALYGDIEHLEVLEKLNIKNASLIVSTIPSLEDNLFLLTQARKINPDILIFVTVNEIKDAFKLYEAGADYVIIPKMLGRERVKQYITTFFSKKANRSYIFGIKDEHIKKINKEIELKLNQRKNK